MSWLAKQLNDTLDAVGNSCSAAAVDKRKMNLLHIIGSLDQRAGGPLRAVLDLSAMSQSLGLQSEVLGVGVLSVADNPLPLELIHALPTKGPAAFEYAPSARRWCRTNLVRFDGVILHGMWSYLNFAVSLECTAAGIPYICFPHGMLDLWSVRGQGWVSRLKKTLYWYCVEKVIVQRSCAVLFTLRRELENARRTFPLPKLHPMIVAPYGVMPRIGSMADGSDDLDPNGPREKVALFLGRVHPKKRPDILIEAWSKAKIEADWRLVIAGPGEPHYMTHLAKLARRCGVEAAVEFTGPVAGTQKQSLLTRASWFLLPSEQENFGIAVLEAVYSGCAIAVSDQVYLGDELPEGSEILPVRLDAWSTFMRCRMRRSIWRDETARRVRAKLMEQFSEENVRRGWVDCIKLALEGNTNQSTSVSGPR